jgi:hypothetical protein
MHGGQVQYVQGCGGDVWRRETTLETLTSIGCNVKVKFALEQATKAREGVEV